MANINVKLAESSKLFEMVQSNGTASTAYFQSAMTDLAALDNADLADIVHFLCILHGRYPGVVDNASTKSVDDIARQWFVQAIEAFSAERAYITRLAVVVGPMMGVGGVEESDATILGQRKALDMLSQSDRKGCALGASLSLALDWLAIRDLLDKISVQLDVEPRKPILPEISVSTDLYDEACADPLVARAANFGCDQILAQHRGLWSILESRHHARHRD